MSQPLFIAVPREEIRAYKALYAAANAVAKALVRRFQGHANLLEPQEKTLIAAVEAVRKAKP